MTNEITYSLVFFFVFYILNDYLITQTTKFYNKKLGEIILFFCYLYSQYFFNHWFYNIQI